MLTALRLIQYPGKSMALRPRKRMMLKWALIFLVISAVAAALGFTGLAGAAVSIAKGLAILALIIFAILLYLVLTAGKGVSETIRRDV